MNETAAPGAVAVTRETVTSGSRIQGTDWVAEEVPVALVYNGISHVVMMATPQDLADLARGFSLTEGIVEAVGEVLGIDIVTTAQGIELQIEVVARAEVTLRARRRNLAGRTGCGLCGAESLQQLERHIPSVTDDLRIPRTAVQRALAALQQTQPLRALTGAVHAAAFCSADGQLLHVREDVGRHNALDKALGALMQAAPASPATGFMLVTSRASYEMVTKTAACGVPLLAAVSAPTSLAVAEAQRLGITLIGYVAPERQAVYTHAERFLGDAHDL